jgi:branched-subunit amino acid aminotransferase/4-amino-4-deoxychorismate lyase
LDNLKPYPDCFDALFMNERGELTEGARSNVFLVTDGRWFTPPLESGLLNGVARQEVLQTHPVEVTRLYHADLLNAEAIYLSNALRGLFRTAWRMSFAHAITKDRGQLTKRTVRSGDP